MRGHKEIEVKEEENLWIQKYVASGDTRYLGKLFEKYKQEIFMHCMKIVKNTEEAKDLASETFIKVFGQIEKFRLDASFRPWLKRIATNLCIDHLRKRSRFKHELIQEDQGATHPEQSAELANQNNLRERMLHVLKRLKPAQRRCFCLFYIHDLSYHEITNLTGYSFAQVRSHIQNGRRKFKMLMEKA